MSDTIQLIDHEAFCNCYNLDTISLHNVEIFGLSAFYNTNLRKIINEKCK